jgi:dTDP-4-amino-4,6-dideoxygalactose transaminase
MQSALPGSGSALGLAELLASRTEMDNWIGLSSGRAALTVSLLALGRLRPGCHEVVVPAYTSYSVAAAVVRAGFRLRCCDIDSETLGLSPKDLERILSPDTLAVVSHHLYGIPCRQREIMTAAADHAVPVIEDAAQAMGLHCLSRPAWPAAHALIFSLSRGKSLPAAGGGLIGTNWEQLARECRRVVAMMTSEDGKGPLLGRMRSISTMVGGLRAVVETGLLSLFIHPSLYWLPASLPQLRLGASIFDATFPLGPLTGFQERLAARLLPKLGTLQEQRRHTAVQLREGIATLPSGDRFWVFWPQDDDVARADFLRLPVLVRHQHLRDRMVAELAARGLGAISGYPQALMDLPELRGHMAASTDCPVARRMSEQLFTLPTHRWVTNGVHDEILGVLDQCSS